MASVTSRLQIANQKSLAALEAKEALGPDSKVAIVDKGFLSRSGQSAFAAGIWTFFDPEQDDMDLWLEEIVTSGEYLNDQRWYDQRPVQIRVRDHCCGISHPFHTSALLAASRADVSVRGA